MEGRTIELRGHGGDTLAARFFEPTPRHGQRAPGIVLVHEVFALDAHVEDVARRLAREGFAVIAPDPYSRRGAPAPTATERDPAPRRSPERILAAVDGLDDRRVLSDLEGALKWLEARDDVDGSKLAALGFGTGGNYAYQLGCASRRVRAVVDFYGRLVYPELSAAKPIQPIELALNLSVPLLAFFGARDAALPDEHRERFRQRLEQGSKHYEFVLEPDAGHGFFDDRSADYRAAAAQRAWARTLDFLRAALDLDDEASER